MPRACLQDYHVVFSRAIHHFRPGPGRWKHGAIPVVGLIGGIGSGKSHVAGGLRARGGVVIDADAVGHRCWSEPEVARAGGRAVRPGDRASSPDGRRRPGRPAGPGSHRLRRSVGAARPRGDRPSRDAPDVRARSSPARSARARPAVVVLDAAILLEAGWDSLCDAVVFVDASLRSGWIASARSAGLDRRGPAAREAAQWPLRAGRRARVGIVAPQRSRPRGPGSQRRPLLSLADRPPPAGPSRGASPVVARGKSYGPLRVASGTPDGGRPRPSPINLSEPQRVPSPLRIDVPRSLDEAENACPAFAARTIPIPAAGEDCRPRTACPARVTRWIPSDRFRPAPSPFVTHGSTRSPISLEQENRTIMANETRPRREAFRDLPPPQVEHPRPPARLRRDRRLPPRAPPPSYPGTGGAPPPRPSSRPTASAPAASPTARKAPPIASRSASSASASASPCGSGPSASRACRSASGWPATGPSAKPARPPRGDPRLAIATAIGTATARR